MNNIEKLAIERKDFEIWWQEQTQCNGEYIQKDDDDIYYEKTSRDAWKVWQARAFQSNEMTKSINELINEIGAERTFFDNELVGAFFTVAKLEAFAKALQQPVCKYGNEPQSCTSSPMDCQCALDATLQQSSEPVAWMLKTGHGTNIQEIKPDCYIDKWQPLFTHPPASVPLEKYNKLLDALKDLLAEAKQNRINAMSFNKTFSAVAEAKAQQSIAEAEGKEG